MALNATPASSISPVAGDRHRISDSVKSHALQLLRASALLISVLGWAVQWAQLTASAALLCFKDFKGGAALTVYAILGGILVTSIRGYRSFSSDGKAFEAKMAALDLDTLYLACKLRRPFVAGEDCPDLNRVHLRHALWRSIPQGMIGFFLASRTLYEIPGCQFAVRTATCLNCPRYDSVQPLSDLEQLDPDRTTRMWADVHDQVDDEQCRWIQDFSNDLWHVFSCDTRHGWPFIDDYNIMEKHSINIEAMDKGSYAAKYSLNPLLMGVHSPSDYRGPELGTANLAAFNALIEERFKERLKALAKTPEWSKWLRNIVSRNLIHFLGYHALWLLYGTDAQIERVWKQETTQYYHDRLGPETTYTAFVYQRAWKIMTLLAFLQLSVSFLHLVNHVTSFLGQRMTKMALLLTTLHVSCEQLLFTSSIVWAALSSMALALEKALQGLELVSHAFLVTLERKGALLANNIEFERIMARESFNLMETQLHGTLEALALHPKTLLAPVMVFLSFFFITTMVSYKMRPPQMPLADIVKVPMLGPLLLFTSKHSVPSWTCVAIQISLRSLLMLFTFISLYFRGTPSGFYAIFALILNVFLQPRLAAVLVGLACTFHCVSGVLAAHYISSALPEAKCSSTQESYGSFSPPPMDQQLHSYYCNSTPVQHPLHLQPQPGFISMRSGGLIQASSDHTSHDNHSYQTSVLV